MNFEIKNQWFMLSKGEFKILRKALRWRLLKKNRMDNFHLFCKYTVPIEVTEVEGRVLFSHCVFE